MKIIVQEVIDILDRCCPLVNYMEASASFGWEVQPPNLFFPWRVRNPSDLTACVIAAHRCTCKTASMLSAGFTINVTDDK